MNITEIQKYLQDNYQYCSEIYEDDDRILIDIDWGDWKHDHLRTDYLMEQIGYKCYDTLITEEDGSDAYSATHYYLKTA